MISVVDDDAAARTSLRLLLKSLGLAATAYDSAAAFLAACDPAQPGCLLLDIRMPGMSGLDLLEELQRRGTRLPAIVITGHTDEGSLQRLSTLRVVGLLEKPFSLPQLRKMLARAAGNPGANGAGGL